MREEKMQDLQKITGFMGGLTPSATLAITAKAKALKAEGLDVCSMAAGEPDFDTPKAVKDACIQALNESKVYYTPASGLPELRKLVAKKFTEENNIPCTFEQCSVLLRHFAAPAMKSSFRHLSG